MRATPYGMHKCGAGHCQVRIPRHHCFCHECFADLPTWSKRRLVETKQDGQLVDAHPTDDYNTALRQAKEVLAEQFRQRYAKPAGEQLPLIA